MKKVLIASLVAIACQASFAQLSVCKAAEEELSEVSVRIAQAYNTPDLDKAIELGRQVVEQLDKGASRAKECGCPGVVGPAKETRASIATSLAQTSLESLQDKLADTLTKAELARMEAEKCWRNAAAAATKKTG